MVVGLNNFEPNQKFEIIKIKYNGAMILFKLMLQFEKHMPSTLKKKSNVSCAQYMLQVILVAVLPWQFEALTTNPLEI